MEIIKIKDSGKNFDVKKKVLVVDDNENKTVSKLNIMKKSDANLSRRKPNGYWNKETIIEELKPICEELGHFPTHNNLIKMNKSSLSFMINKHGGFNHFREVMEYKIIKKSKDYWTEEIIIEELKLVINKLRHFPTHNDLIKNNESSLSLAINKHGGYNHFRKMLNYEIIQVSPGYWTEDTIMKELKPIIEELGYFPTAVELGKIKGDLAGIIPKNGGFNYFRKMLNYEIIQVSPGYWTEEIIIKELKIIIEKLGHFPSANELYKLDKNNLSIAINKHDEGINYFREKCGFSISIHEKYISKLMSYVNKRGYGSEDIVKDIINDWSINNNKSCPDFNVKLAPGNVIEFVCDSNKRIGIDVTNTKASKHSAYATIQKKWKKKDYCLYLDELWIVVFTDVLKSKHYSELNEMSPDNVKVLSIDDFTFELDYYTEGRIQDKIDQLKDCSFHTKDELININRPVIGWL